MKPKGIRNKSRKRIVNGNGYIQVYEPLHPTAMKNGYCLEHRMIAWEAGLLLNLSDIVHHKNENKIDNRIGNLGVMSNGDHTSHHFKGLPSPRRNSKPCSTNDCKTLTASKYGLCRKHYKLEWQRGNIYEHKHLLEKES